MKFIKTFFLGMTTLSLVACAGGVPGTAVSQEKFNEQAAKVEDRSYTKATVTYSVVEKVTGEKDVKTSGKLEYTFNEGSFQLNDNQTIPDSLELESYVGGMAVELQATIPSEYKPKFYTGPLGVSFSYSTKAGEGASYSATASMSGYMQFNEYGYLVKATIETKSTTKVSLSLTAQGGGKTQTITSSGKSEINISYQ